MKHTLVTIAAALLITSCNQGDGNMEALKKENDSLRSVLSKNAANRDVVKENNLDNLPFLIDTATAEGYIKNWHMYSAMFAGYRGFIVNRADINHALQVFPNTTGFVFYMGCTGIGIVGRDSLKLFWQPAATDPTNGYYIAEYEALGNSTYIYDHTDPCPTCRLLSGMDGIDFMKPPVPTKK